MVGKLESCIFLGREFINDDSSCYQGFIEHFGWNVGKFWYDVVFLLTSRVILLFWQAWQGLYRALPNATILQDLRQLDQCLNDSNTLAPVAMHALLPTVLFKQTQSAWFFNIVLQRAKSIIFFKSSLCFSRMGTEYIAGMLYNFFMIANTSSSLVYHTLLMW